MKLKIIFILVFVYIVTLNTNAKSDADSIYYLTRSMPDDSVKVEKILLAYKKCVRDTIRVDWLEEAFNISTKINYNLGIGKYYDYLGVNARYAFEYQKSVKYHKKALSYLEGTWDWLTFITCLNNIGVTYRKMNNEKEALNYYLQALRIAELNSDKKNIAIALNGIGNIYQNMGNYDEAIKYYQRSLSYEIKNDNKRGIVFNLNNIGEIFNFRNQFDSALKYHFKALDMEKVMNYRESHGIICNCLGDVYLKMKNYQKAEEWYNNSFTSLQAKKNVRYISNSLIGLGTAQVFLSKNNAAIQNLNEGLKLALSIHSFENVIEAYEGLALANEKQGKYSEAIKNYKSAWTYRDSMINVKNNETIAALQTAYESDKKEREIELLTQQNLREKEEIKNTRLILFTTFVITILVVLLFILVYKRLKVNSRNKALDLEQKLLRSQLNPHFLFNALGSIQNYMYKNDARQAARYLGNFASLTRSILENSAEEYVPLSEEIKTLTNYIELEQMRLNNSFSYSINTDENIETEFVYILPMLLQPFVENAIKHGLQNSDKPGVLEITFSLKTNRIFITIADNGIGTDSYITKNNQQHKSMSMQIFEKRRKLFEKNTGQTIKFTLTDLKQTNPGLSGTKVEIEIPVTEKK